MNFAVRADASQKIGVGHVMRCLTLADTLRTLGASIQFVSRYLPENFRQEIERRGHGVAMLPEVSFEASEDVPHAQWLGASQEVDCQQTREALAGKAIEGIIVDNYAIDYRWHDDIRSVAPNVLVIDDLADRRHRCDILLDQNLYRNIDTRYGELIDDKCQPLLGPKFALLRPEFSELRQKAQVRKGELKRVFVLYGGADSDNWTLKTVRALAQLLDGKVGVDVVVGSIFPFREEVAKACDELGYDFHVQPENLAQLMLNADAAIGAGGAVSWERCCLGLPSAAVALADNQKQLVRDGGEMEILFPIDNELDTSEKLADGLYDFINNSSVRETISAKGFDLVDGLGADKVAKELLKLSGVHS